MCRLFVHGGILKLEAGQGILPVLLQQLTKQLHSNVDRAFLLTKPAHLTYDLERYLHSCWFAPSAFILALCAWLLGMANSIMMKC